MLNRRRFLKSTAASTAATLVAAPAIVRGRNLNSKLQIAGIGCEAKGWSDISEMASHPQAKYVAFCDVDLDRTAKVRKLNPEAPVFQDYREMLEKVGDKFDAVTVSTADHMHAIQALTAMQKGKHVYCQKPLTHTVEEARTLRKAAEKMDLITRLGNQIHSHTHYRTAVRIVQDGLIGKVKRVHSWSSATGHGKSGYMDRPEPSIETPKSVNWDLWIGVAPMRPYGAVRCYHPWGWRDFQAFGNGALGDFGCHILDPVFTALKIAAGPTKFTADHTGMNNEVWPAQTQVDYHFPGTDLTAGNSIQITWYDGGRLPTTSGSHIPETTALPRQGSILIGEQGTLVIPHVGPPRLYPEEKFAAAIEPAENLNHYHGWIDGCLSGKQPSDGFDYGGLLTEAVLLGNIGVRLRGQTLEWDDKAFKFPNSAEATRWLTREYRQGWDFNALAAKV